MYKFKRLIVETSSAITYKVANNSIEKLIYQYNVINNIISILSSLRLFIIKLFTYLKKYKTNLENYNIGKK